MTLTNQTTLRGFCTHFYSLLKRQVALHGEWSVRGGGARDMSSMERQRADWDVIQRDVYTLLGVQLSGFDALLGGQGLFPRHDPGAAGADPMRIRLGVLKKLADRARQRGKDVKIMTSWDLAAHEAQEDEDA